MELITSNLSKLKVLYRSACFAGKFCFKTFGYAIWLNFLSKDKNQQETKSYKTLWEHMY